jgi:hypothetical protein
VEIFINDGEGVMSSRLPGLSGAADFQRCDAGAFCYWPLRAMHGRISVLLSGSWRRDENQTRNH